MQPQTQITQRETKQKIRFQGEQNSNRVIINNRLVSLLDSQSSLDTEVNSLTSQQSSFEEQGFQVIGKQSDNQALVVKLQPENVLWHKGVSLFSSKKTTQNVQFDDIIKRFIQNLGLYSFNPRVLSNSGNQMSYYILSKEQPLNGKILILSHNIYKEHFYINLNHLLTVNYDNTQYNLKKHPDIKYLKLLQPTSVNLPLFITLQSSKDTTVIEKYLGADQCLYLPNAKILAMSESIKCKWQGKYRQFKLTGEGYVFFQPKSQLSNAMAIRNREIIFINMIIIIIIVSLYIIEYLYLI